MAAAVDAAHHGTGASGWTAAALVETSPATRPAIARQEIGTVFPTPEANLDKLALAGVPADELPDPDHSAGWRERGFQPPEDTCHGCMCTTSGARA